MNYELGAVLCALVVILVTIYLYLTANFTHWKIREVNGPAPLPVFGNFLEISLGRTSLEDYLKDVYRRFSSERIVGLFSGAEPILMLKDLEVVSDVLTKDLLDFHIPGIPKGKTESTVTSLFSFATDRCGVLGLKMSMALPHDAIKRTFYLLAECAELFEMRLNEVTLRNEVVDCCRAMEKFSGDAIGACMFGLGPNNLTSDESEFVRKSRMFAGLSAGKLFAKGTRKGTDWLYGLIGRDFTDQQAYKYFASIVAETVKRRRNNGLVRHDFMDVLLDLKEHPLKLSELVLTDEGVVAQAVAFLTTTFRSCPITVARALLELGHSRDIQDRLRKEITSELGNAGGIISYEGLSNMKYLDLVLKETLRKYPPVTHFARISRKNYRFTGTNAVIPNGQKVWIPVYAIHRDPNIYPSPEVFDPERFRRGDFESANPMSYLPFGDGSGNCIGTAFAICQMKLALVQTLKNYKVDLCGKTDAPCSKEKCGAMPKSGIFVKLTKLNGH